MRVMQELLEKELLDGGIRVVKIESRLKRLAEIREFIGRNAKACGFDDDAIFEIKLATSEAAANAIEHGSPNPDSNEVAITVRCINTDFLVIIEDQGTFRKGIPAPSEETSYRGRGIPLMLALMDKITVDERAGGTRVTLFKNLPSTAGSSRDR